MAIRLVQSVSANRATIPLISYGLSAVAAH
jgi:hypothetical protein